MVEAQTGQSKIPYWWHYLNPSDCQVTGEKLQLHATMSETGTNNYN